MNGLKRFQCSMKQAQFEILKQALNIPHLIVEVHLKWASTKTHHRQQIRQAIMKTYEQEITRLTRSSADPDLIKKDLKALEDLEQVPDLNLAQVSISHCPKAGGFALSDISHPLGFDLEDPDRIRETVVKRMSEPQELTEAPSPAHLWTAKESAFKALYGPMQPQVISAVTIRQWFPLTPEIWAFRAAAPGLNEVSGQGCILPILGLNLGIFALTP